MSTEPLPESVVRVLWDVDVASLDLERDRALVFERVVARGDGAAMCWLRVHHAKAAIADFVRTEGARKLTPRDLAYWALVSDVELASSPGGGRPRWAGA